MINTSLNTSDLKKKRKKEGLELVCVKLQELAQIKSPWICLKKKNVFQKISFDIL